LDFAAEDQNTLVIVTADHETGGFAIEGGSLQDYEVEGDFTTAKHTATMVPIFAYGPGAEDFMGIFDNTEIFRKMLKAYNFRTEEP
jgi:alkaline phosphatase